MGILFVPLFLRRRTIIDEDKHFGQHPCPPAEIRAVEGNFDGDFLLTPGEKPFGRQS
jgi:hypothetical protein